MRVCCACLLVDACMSLVLAALVLLHTRGFVSRGVPLHLHFILVGVHVHARVLRVLAFSCLHVLGVTCTCFLDAHVGVCA
jgi:hypothetical protein